jgi:hypothetical protein
LIDLSLVDIVMTYFLLGFVWARGFKPSCK